MKGTVEIFGKNLEYDFLSAWIKYTRLEKEITQEALAYGICSTSHLSYFENGKKKLRGDLIEAILKKLNITEIIKPNNLGLLRRYFYSMLSQIKLQNYDEAKIIFNKFKHMKDVLSNSPYNVEFKIYQLIYNTYVENFNYKKLSHDLCSIDKIYDSLDKDLKYLYSFISGIILFRHKSHNKGIKRLLNAYDIKKTSWINYNLGYCFCFNNEPLKGLFYFEKALEGYEKNGRYINAVWCNNYLGVCYTYLKMYSNAEKHFKAALTGTEYFNIDKLFIFIYTNLSNLYINKKEYNESIKWSKLAIELEGTYLMPCCNYITACFKLNKIDECKKIFNIYLTPENSTHVYYNYLYFLYLEIFNFKDELFYQEVTNNILPFYEKLNHIIICTRIRTCLIKHLESKRKYKEATKHYKKLLS